MTKIAVFLFAVLLPSTALAADAGDLHKAIAAACGCQVMSVRVVDPTNSATWSVRYDPSATPAQQAAGNAVIPTFNMDGLSGSATVSAMQAKVALSNAGLLIGVQNWINTQSAATQLIWNSATTFRRDSTLVNQAAAALGLSAAQVDQLFVAAEVISP